MAIDSEYPSDPGSIFRQYIVGSLQESLRRIYKEGKTLQDETRVQALYVLDHAFKIDEAWSDARALLLGMSSLMEQGGNWQVWVSYLQKGIKTSQLQDDPDVEAMLKLDLGVIYQLLGTYDIAETSLISSAIYFKKQKNHPKQAKALNQLAYVLCLKSQYIKSKNIIRVVMRLLEEKDAELANCYLVRGMIAYEFRDWDDAAFNFQQAIQIWKSVGNRRETARNLRNLGGIWHTKKDYSQAITCYTNALNVFREIDDSVQYAITEMNLGIICYAQTQFQEAKSLYLSAESVFHRVQDKLNLARIQTNQAQVYRALGEWELATYVCLASIRLWEELGNKRWAINGMDELGLIYKGQGEYERAINQFRSALRQVEELPEGPSSQRLFELLNLHIEEVKENLRLKQSKT